MPCNPLILIGVPNGSRTLVADVKGRCPWPLDDGNPLNCGMRNVECGIKKTQIIYNS